MLRTFESRQHLPAAVIVVAVFLGLAAAVAFVTGFSLLIPGTGIDRIWALNPRAYAAFGRGGRASGVVLLALCVVAAVSAAGLLQRRRWAWGLALGIFGMNGLGDVISLPITHDWLKAGAGVLVAAAFFALLLRSEVRVFFANRS